MTIAEKILAKKSGLSSVVPAQIVDAYPDLVMSHTAKWRSVSVMERSVSTQSVWLARFQFPRRVWWLTARVQRAGGNLRGLIVLGKVVGAAGQPDESGLADPEVSADGIRIAVDRNVQNNINIYLLDGLRRTRFTFDAAQGQPEPSDPVPLFQPRIATGSTSSYRAQYDVAPDGRFLINDTTEDAAASPITLLLNWKPPAK